jgi:hypothetical protein
MRRMKEMNQSRWWQCLEHAWHVQSSSKYKFTTSHYYSKYWRQSQPRTLSKTSLTLTNHLKTY